MINGGADIGYGLTCGELVDLITEYTEEALDPASRERFEAHLSLCTGCRHHLGQVEATRIALRHLGRADLTSQSRDQLLSIYRDWRQQRGGMAAG